MTPNGRKSIAALAMIAALAVALAFLAYLGSEAKIAQRYTLPSSVTMAAKDANALAWGAHVAMLYGCKDCHTAPGLPSFTGRMLAVPPGLAVAAPNLRRFMASEGAAGLDIAVRRGLSPAAKALWDMPVGSYVFMNDKDLESLAAYLQTLKVTGPVWPGKRFSFRARLAVLAGTLKPAGPYALGREPPRWLGKRYEGGRYLAMMACTSCHGSALNGVRGGAPDLRVAGAYSRGQFFALMREGTVPQGRRAPQMASLAARRFRAFKDFELNALYDYLIARAAPLDAQGPPPQGG